MKLTEILRLVWLNLVQNKSKVFLTSVGIVAGSATIMMVLAIGRGGQLEVAEQFRNLNAGAIDIVGEAENDTQSGGPGFPFGRGGGGGGMRPPMGGGGFGPPGMMQETQKKKSLTISDMEDLELFVSGISDVTISFQTKAGVEGGSLEEETSYTIAGVMENYCDLSNLKLAIGDFLTQDNEDGKEKVCVLGAKVARDIFSGAYEAYDSTVYIDARPYTVSGVIGEMGTVASGISPDDAIFIPYSTGIKYLTGDEVNPTITVIAEDVERVDGITVSIKEQLQKNYPDTEFTITDAGTRMEAASKSNETLQLLLIAMALIVFFVGGIGIMNVLFVSVKERTNEIGILKAIGCSRRDILTEFLLEASFTSLLGAFLGVLLATAITPVIESFSVRVELTVFGAVLSLVFGVLTGTLFGFYPAYKASRLIPVEALNHE